MSNTKGWAGMMPEGVTPEEKKDMERRQMALANSFRTTFENGAGPEVLQAIRQFAYGSPRFEEGHPNFTEMSFIRGGIQEVSDYISTMIMISKQGEYNAERSAVQTHV